MLLLGGRAARADERREPEAGAPRILQQPDMGYTFAQPQYYPSFAWIATQLVPSPEVGIGSVRHIDATGQESVETAAAFGLRWQITPVLWSWGVNRHVNRWRFFVVDPLARSAGSIAFDTSFEYLFGHVSRVLVRPGVHATFPLVERGEYLSASIGTSTYQYDDTTRVSYDVGLYFLYGILGAQVSYAPNHAPLRTIATFRIRYF